MLSKTQKKRISFSIKTLLVLLCLAYLYSKLSAVDAKTLTTNFIQKLTGSNRYYLLITIILVFANWSIEAVKWKLLIQRLEPITFAASLKSILAGISASLVTPNRAGEFIGKLFFLRKASKPDALILSMVGSISQVMLTLCFGLVALHQYLFKSALLTAFYYPLLFFVVGVILVSFYLFYNFKNIAISWKKWNFIHSIIPYNFQSIELPARDLSKVILLSLCRYIIFTVQFLLVLKIANLIVHPIESALLVFLYFFIVSLVPTFALTELGVRGSVAVALFCENPESCAEVLTAAFIVWFINLALPAIVGAYYVFQLRFFNSENE
ncbi:MAG TPA: lysylphosphatidylglycerol synthase transmembrane domain-containing protein [Bacteroidia bacterium]|nr:lysylphosphatidylglycerol synthase transmembrane domain-containing protein [Bacteroidia bacterium]HRH09089.1 lysylphosphatidylglycerol synthase transmembrane domain-containing protein [Bacteroidia bacterium]HRH62338.1 lysylphosphatidylglycerol synthase transmembrane domain-containing protein [Bacteroidia bacterium]